MMSALSLTSARMSKLWIPSKTILDGVLCKNIFYFHIFSLFPGFQTWFYQTHWFYLYLSFKHSKWWRHKLEYFIQIIIFLCSLSSRESLLSPPARPRAARASRSSHLRGRWLHERNLDKLHQSHVNSPWARHRPKLRRQLSGYRKS